MERLDGFFDKHPINPKKYFIISLLLCCGTVLSAFLSILAIVWLVWLGPRYLRRYDQKLVIGLGTLAFFTPAILYFFMLWLGQPGWPLDSFMGDRHTDFPALLSLIALTLAVYGLLVLRMKLYNSVSVKRHSKKDLSQ